MFSLVCKGTILFNIMKSCALQDSSFSWGKEKMLALFPLLNSYLQSNCAILDTANPCCRRGFGFTVPVRSVVGCHSALTGHASLVPPLPLPLKDTVQNRGRTKCLSVVPPHTSHSTARQEKRLQWTAVWIELLSCFMNRTTWTWSGLRSSRHPLYWATAGPHDVLLWVISAGRHESLLPWKGHDGSSMENWLIRDWNPWFVTC